MTAPVAGAPHVALVSWGFPPFRGSGTFRPLALANALAAAGARVTVIAAARETFLVHYGPDPALESLIDPAVNVLRVPWYPENGWPLVNDWGAARAADPRADAVRRNRVVPDFPEKVYDSWLPRADAALRALHGHDPVAAVIGTGSPYGDLEAAVTVATDVGVPVILDDRDSFLADVFTGGTHPLFEQRLPFARRWFDRSTEVWFVNPPIADWHRDRFPDRADRFVVVENGWDPGTVVPATEPRRAPVTRIGYVGLVPSNFPMATVLAGWEQARAAFASDCELVFTGPLGYEVGSPKWQAMAAQIDAAAGVSWAGQVSRTELAGVYAELDALLLAKEGGRLVTGGKTYEYAATGLPIAAVVDPTSDAVRVLRDHPRFHLAADDSAGAAAAAFTGALADAVTGDAALLRAAQAVGARHSREAALAPAVARVMTLCSS